MKNFLYACALLLGGLPLASLAGDPACESQADDRKLAGAARSSWVQKCHRESAGKTRCQARAADRRLSGAARTSFIRRCEADARSGKAGSPAPAPAASAARPAARAGGTPS